MAPSQLVLGWKDHSCTLLSVFENLFRNNTLVDCTLAAGGQYLKAHKMVLCACSSYFELLFGQESEKNPIVILKDVEFQDLVAAVNFMYKGEVEICEDRLEIFLEVAESLQIKGLGCYGKRKRSEEKSSTLLKKTSNQKLAVSPRHHSRKETLNSPSDSESESDIAGQRPNEPVGCEPVRNNENSAVHQSLQSESSRSSPTLPPSSFSNQGGRVTQNKEDSFENNQSSLTALPQVSSGENEHSVRKPVIKIEPVDDTCAKEEFEDVDMDFRDFRDTVIKMEDQEDQDIGIASKRIKTEVGRSEYPEGVQSRNQPSLEGAENVIITKNQQSAGSSTRGNELNTACICGRSAKSIISSTQFQDPQVQESEKPICPECDKTFSSSVNLIKHIQLHDINRNHKCSKYSAQILKYLTYHFRKHSGGQPYKCPYCTQVCKSSSSLTKHVKTHSLKKPYQCPGCNYKSHIASDLSLHQQIHCAEMSYQCPECEYKTDDALSLVQHRLVHSGEKLYKSPACDYKSNSASGLVAHQQSHSGEKPDQ